MRFATLIVDNMLIWGMVNGEMLAPISSYPSLCAALSTTDLATAAAAADRQNEIPISSSQFAPLIPEPGKIVCVGLNYEKHRQETQRAVVTSPTIFTRFSDSQTGHCCNIVRPIESQQLDYEGELAVIVGKRGRRIKQVDALKHIAGYSCYNDATVRDWQYHTTQFGPGKNWPQTGSFGPWLVTPDEFGLVGQQRLQTRLNGKVMQDATLSDMIFSLPQLIEYVSTFTPLSPGDVIVTGTPGGVGHKCKPPIYLKSGDQVEVEIDGIGVLTNTIVCHN